MLRGTSPLKKKWGWGTLMATWLSSRTTDPLSLRRPSCHRGLVGVAHGALVMGSSWGQTGSGPRARRGLASSTRGQEAPGPRLSLWGGLPVGGFSARIPATMGDSGVSGCARRLRLDRWPLGTLTWVVGVTPCFSGPLEKGLFFAGTGSCHSRQPGGCSAMHA